MACTLDSVMSDLGSSPGWCNSDIFKDKMYLSHSASAHPGV